MATYSGESIVDSPEWRIALLFVLFIVITFAFDWGSEWLDHYLHANLKHGLRHTVKQLEEETLILGVISLMLIALEVSPRTWTCRYLACVTSFEVLSRAAVHAAKLVAYTT